MSTQPGQPARRRSLNSRAPLLAVIESLAVVVAVVSALHSSRDLSDQAYQIELLLAVLTGYVLSLGGPVVVVVVTLYKALWAEYRQDGLAVLAVGYVILLFGFASGYFMICILGDKHDLDDQWAFYSAAGRASGPLPPRGSKREFRGIDQRLWADLEDEELERDDPRQRAANLARRAQVGARRDTFVGDNVPSVYLDCLHYSIVTMATVGYGDISPAGWWAKVMTDFQILSGQALFLFAIGVVLGKPLRPSTQTQVAAGEQPPPAVAYRPASREYKPADPMSARTVAVVTKRLV